MEVTANNKVPPGYKQTEVGVIPEDWRVESIAEISSVGRGRVISHREIARSRNPQYPVYSSQTSNLGVMGYLDNFEFEGEYITWTTDGANAGTVFLRNGRFNCTNVCGTIKLKADNHRFVANVLGTIAPHHVSRQLGNPKLMNDVMKRVKIPLPPTKAEQKAIGEVSNDIETFIGSLDQLIAKKGELKQAAMQTLLTGKTRLPGFSGEWEAKRLGELGSFLKGRGVTKDQSMSGNLACVIYGEIYTRHSDYIKAFHSWISRDVAKTATRLLRGDILFAGSGETKEEIGKCVAFLDDVEAYGGGDIVILRTEGADPLFLGYYLNTAPINQQKGSKGQGDAVVHISATALADIRGLFPTVAEQSAIAAVLFDIDAELTRLEQRREKARALAQGIMQELLTGKTRLI